MTQFASVAELNALQDTDFDESDPRPVRLLQLASSLIQAEARQRLEYVVDDVVVLRPGADELDVITLPDRPALSVSEVVLAPAGLEPYAVNPDFYEFRAWGEIQIVMWPEWPINWPSGSAVQVTYTHGFDPIPDDILVTTCSIVGRMLLNASPTYQPSSPAPAQSNAGVEVFPEYERKQIRERYRPRVFSARIRSA